MFCPGCGAKNSTDQRFCRNCGLNLESAAQSLLEQFPAGRVPGLDRRERMLERFGQFAFGGFGVVLLVAILGIIYTILTRMVLSGEQPWAGLLLIAFIIFAAMTLAYVVFAEDLKEKRKKWASSLPAELEGRTVSTGKLMEEREFQPIPTVTENTTDLLPTKDRSR
jgi:hypothetical protein